MNKSELAIAEILEDSSMSVQIKKADLSGEPQHIVIKVRGKAGRIPSTTNSRLNMFPKVGIRNVLQEIIDRHSHNDNNVRLMVKRAIDLLMRTHVASTINPEHKLRLTALTRLWYALPRKPKTLICDKDNRWHVMLFLHEDLHRVDSHNLTKPVCDWLQEIGLIENDKHVDCYPVRIVDIGSDMVEEGGCFYLALRKVGDVRTEVRALASVMLNG